MSIAAQDIDQRIYDLYDEYCHGGMDRRGFLRRASAISVAGASGLAMAQALLPRYAEAQTISFTDERIKASYVTYESPGGTSGEMRGYLVRPSHDGPYSTVLTIHENRGLNPYIEDVARRLAVAGFMSLAPDGLWGRAASCFAGAVSTHVAVASRPARTRAVSGNAHRPWRGARIRAGLNVTGGHRKEGRVSLIQRNQGIALGRLNE